MILPIHQRMAELTRMIDRDRNLTPKTINALRKELNRCLLANEAYCTKMARLENLSLLASETGDTEWLHNICAEIEQLQS